MLTEVKETLYLIKRFEDIYKKPISLPIIQKLLYILKFLGIATSYEYLINFKGPWSEDIIYDINIYQLEKLHALELTFDERKTEYISLKKDFDLGSYSNKEIDHVIYSFGDKDLYELMLITTILYGYTHTKDLKVIQDKTIQLLGGLHSEKEEREYIAKIIKMLHEDKFLSKTFKSLEGINFLNYVEGK